VHFPVALFSPALKVPPLAIIAIICEPKFGPNEVYVLIVDNHPAIIVDGMMPHRPDRQYTEQEQRALCRFLGVHSNVKEDILAVGIRDDASEHFPGMKVRIILKKVIETAIAAVRTPRSAPSPHMGR
jgi:hypothetical protein